jgi:hypothetical protein
MLLVSQGSRTEEPMADTSLAGKTAIVTGAARGIGRGRPGPTSCSPISTATAGR